MASLPAPPRALASILDAASDPDVQIDSLARMVAADPSFAAVVLKTANTTRYRGSRQEPITDLRQATLRLGVRSLRNYALCHTARCCAASGDLGEFDLNQFWEDCVRRAVAAELLAEHLHGVDPREAFTVGLLLEVGVVVLMMAHPEHAGAWGDVQHAEPIVRLSQELVLFGRTHADTNAELAEEWQLPDEIALPLIHHHNADSVPTPLRDMARVAAGAETLASVLSSHDKRSTLDRANHQLADLIGADTDKVSEIVDALGQRVQDAAEALGIHVGEQPRMEDILKAANQSLVNMNLSYEDLVRRLEALIIEKEALAAQLDERNRELQRLSVTDTLTQLPNRRELFRRLNDELHRIKRHGTSLAMVVADIDHFKRINDTWGHVFGDEVLTKVATTLGGCARTNDVVARVGGEEFAALLPNTDLRGGATLANRMRVSVSRLPLTAPDGQTVRITVSFGIAWLQGPWRGPTNIEAVSTQLYSAADGALYHSKKNGRNRVTPSTDAVPWAQDVAA
ncbi:MAG: diguanylate cyclase [Myxococcales bacterium]|nr:diguanylate cyclase [Myxococcales bacterium]